MIGVTAHAHRASILDADEHSASDRTIAARRRHPPVRDTFRRCVAGDWIVRVRIAVRQDVQAERPFQIEAVHAASIPRYGATRCFGTALTKNKYRPRASLPRASANAT